MQINWIWEMQCNKRKYEDERMAKRAVKAFNKLGNHFAGQEVYKCHRCDGWHTSSLKRRKNKELRRLKKQGKI